jgi:DNA-binding CsgD family transcriptional regulator
LPVAHLNSKSCSTDLAPVISAIGHEGFAASLLEYVHAACGAEHCTIFQMQGSRLRQAATVSISSVDELQGAISVYTGEDLWQRDPAFRQVQKAARLNVPVPVRMRTADLKDAELRDRVYRPSRIAERILLAQGCGEGSVWISILRSESEGNFSQAHYGRLVAVSHALLALVAKHAEFSSSQATSLALTSLQEIEACLTQAQPQLPRREAQVCSRVLFGMMTAGVASDLGVGEETVATYRKRLYHRLNISCHRELLVWYLDQRDAIARRRQAGSGAMRMRTDAPWNNIQLAS